MPADPADAGAPRPAAVVLAGGRSSRFGSPKAEARFLGRPMLQWVVDALQSVASEIVVAGPAGEPVALAVESGAPLRHVSDPAPNQGPLAGIVTAFETLDTELAFVVSCDAPLLQPPVLRALAELLGGEDAAVPRADDRPQPLPALYRVRPCLPPFRAELAAQRRGIYRVLEELDVRPVSEAEIKAVDPQLLSFRGINTPEELAALEAEARRLGIGPAQPHPRR